MSPRGVSREPYRVRRDRREVVRAIAVAVAIILVTVLAVWILAPSDDDPVPTFRPPVTAPSTTVPTDPSATTTPPVTEPPTTTSGG